MKPRSQLLLLLIAMLLFAWEVAAEPSSSTEVPKRWTVPLDFAEPEPEPVPEQLPGPQAVQEPEDIGVVVYRSGDRFEPLELQRCLIQERSPFFSTVLEQLLLVPKPRSPIRFAKDQPKQFYLRVFVDDGDPRAGFFPLRDPSLFTVVRLESQRNDRKVSLLRSGVNFTDRDLGRPLLARLYGDYSFVLTPVEPLPPGEYALMYRAENESGAFDLFCFGVDK